MKKLRSNVFETNSSSCHSLVIDKKSDYDTIPNNGISELEGGQFGWGYKELTIPIERLNYVAVIIYILKDIVKPFKSIDYNTCLKNFESVVYKQTGATKLIYNFSTSDYKHSNYSYIDHQSCDSEGRFKFLLDPEKIRNLIFRNSSIIIIDNDQH